MPKRTAASLAETCHRHYVEQFLEAYEDGQYPSWFVQHIAKRPELRFQVEVQTGHNIYPQSTIEIAKSNGESVIVAIEHMGSDCVFFEWILEAFKHHPHKNHDDFAAFESRRAFAAFYRQTFTPTATCSDNMMPNHFAVGAAVDQTFTEWGGHDLLEQYGLSDEMKVAIKEWEDQDEDLAFADDEPFEGFAIWYHRTKANAIAHCFNGGPQDTNYFFSARWYDALEAKAQTMIDANKWVADPTVPKLVFGWL